jgi:cystathionine beta-lyase
MMNDAALREKLYFIQKSCGAVPGPMDCFLVLRGIKTLGVRMKAHCENGKIIANWLRKHPKVAKVYWPGFEDHPGHAIAKKQMRDFGGMISRAENDSVEEARRFYHPLTCSHWQKASVSGVMINHPAHPCFHTKKKELRTVIRLTDTAECGH